MHWHIDSKLEICHGLGAKHPKHHHCRKNHNGNAKNFTYLLLIGSNKNINNASNNGSGGSSGSGGSNGSDGNKRTKAPNAANMDVSPDVETAKVSMLQDHVVSSMATASQKLWHLR